MLRINEIFYSVQGEGVHQGLPTLFIRLQGCNLLGEGCKFCDTSYSRKEGGELYTTDSLMKKVEGYKLRYNQWVCLTGGEPLWQLDGLEELVRELQKKFLMVEIFTNGSIVPPRWWTLPQSWVVDMKGPSSGVNGTSKEDWFGTRYCDQIKFVIGTQKDLDWAKEQIRKFGTHFNGTFLVSPVFEPNGYLNKVIMEEVVGFCKSENVRLSVQVHKFLWGNKKGV